MADHTSELILSFDPLVSTRGIMLTLLSNTSAIKT
jgi:hypothetical protein